ncbi:MAG: bifunctional isocitrate dehydrogenase kinase/phosphatase [Gammaproteobacteria bacterium]|nr:bifunctional isocitrate dehydrogenase kinase/phosphatase [Gammaproteobacteria bacterium]MYJ51853.1 bifunctional isocitrate dehydrogenase kinase/phosphatase [Gammaproteobacteria bacterium]
MNDGDRFRRDNVADLVLGEFRDFYHQFKDIPELSRRAFEDRDHAKSLRLSSRRLQLYSISIRKLSDRIKRICPVLARDESRWEEVEKQYLANVEGDYAADLAMAYLHSIRRKIYQGEWRVNDYASYRSKYETDEVMGDQIARHEIRHVLTVDTVKKILEMETFSVPFENLDRDAERIVRRAYRNLDLESRIRNSPMVIEMFRAGFYRNRGAYLVGRTTFDHEHYRPFIIALLNGGKGIYVDALITSATYAHNMFSSTLANFHVTNFYYHELCRFLRSIMPMRPLGLHYTTVGYNHLGKVAVMNELEAEFESDRRPMDVAPGKPGTVAIGFCMPDSAYVLKVIRDTPASGYKWGAFGGVESVLEKYCRVHEINRTDSMLDAMIYYNLRLDVSWFATPLLEEILEHAASSVHRDGRALVFRYLIVQRRLTPLPIYLENSTPRQAETAMANLGYCIKNNAAGNIFNRDLDARNYGVTSYLKVYLYDYDALEELTDVKIRTNTDRIEGEEDIPDWYFEDGVVFLPEELVTGLCLPYRTLRRRFEVEHPMLLTVDYWESIQRDLQRGKVPVVSVYPDTERLDDENS